MTTETAAKTKVYVCYPEEPFSFVAVNGRTLRFNNGRLVSTLNKLSAADIEWFIRRNEQLGRERYIVFIDTPSTAQSQALLERCMATAAGKAVADNPGIAMQDARVMFAMMMADPDHVQEVQLQPSAANMLDQIRKLMPATTGADPLFQELQSNIDRSEMDRRVIAAALDGRPLDEAPTPETIPSTPPADPPADPPAVMMPSVTVSATTTAPGPEATPNPGPSPFA